MLGLEVVLSSVLRCLPSEWAQTRGSAASVFALALFGVDEIGVEIEDPFGDDPNDLPLDAIGRGIEAAVGELLR